MPLEFSVAAYRFGHSMVRPVYRLSAENLPSQTEAKGLDGRKMVFSKIPDDGLNGFREFPASWGIDWALFFETPGHKLSPDNKGPKRIQPAYKIDTSLVSPLAALPEFSIKGTNDPIDETGAEPPRKEINMLALRNLIRGNKVRLPSGQSVAQRMGLIPIPDERLLVGKANVDGLTGKKPNQSIVTISPEFAGHAPLWFYILAEAQDQWVQETGKLPKGATDDAKNAVHIHLGPVGGRIVAEVLIGLLWGDGTSFLRANPNFKPEFGNPAAASVFDRFTMGDLVVELKNQPLPND